MADKNNSADRFDYSGNYTHTDYYDNSGNKTGSKVDRYDLGGEYKRSDNYDKHGNKTGTSDNEYHDDSNSNSGSSGGCFITTAVCNSLQKPDDCYELTVLRNFRDNWLTAQPQGIALIKDYYVQAPLIVNTIDKKPNRNEIYSDIFVKYIRPCILLIEELKPQECFELYCKMVENLKSKYSSGQVA